MIGNLLAPWIHIFVSRWIENILEVSWNYQLTNPHGLSHYAGPVIPWRLPASCQEVHVVNWARSHSNPLVGSSNLICLQSTGMDACIKTIIFICLFFNCYTNWLGIWRWPGAKLPPCPWDLDFLEGINRGGWRASESQRCSGIPHNVSFVARGEIGLDPWNFLCLARQASYWQHWPTTGTVLSIRRGVAKGR